MRSRDSWPVSAEKSICGVALHKGNIMGKAISTFRGDTQSDKSRLWFLHGRDYAVMAHG
jgi:hypothetical protein